MAGEVVADVAARDTEPLPPREGDGNNDGPEFLRAKSDRNEPEAPVARFEETEAELGTPERRSTDPLVEWPCEELLAAELTLLDWYGNAFLRLLRTHLNSVVRIAL